MPLYKIYPAMHYKYCYYVSFIKVYHRNYKHFDGDKAKGKLSARTHEHTKLTCKESGIERERERELIPSSVS